MDHSHSALVVSMLVVIVLFLLCAGWSIAMQPVRAPANAEVRRMATAPQLVVDVPDANVLCGRCYQPGHEVGPLSRAGFCRSCTARVAAFRQVEHIEDFTEFTIPAQLRPFTGVARRGA